MPAKKEMKKPPGRPIQSDREYTTLTLSHDACITPTVVRAAARDGLAYIKTRRGRIYTGEAWLAWLRTKSNTYAQAKAEKDERSLRVHPVNRASGQGQVQGPDRPAD